MSSDNYDFDIFELEVIKDISDLADKIEGLGLDRNFEPDREKIFDRLYDAIKGIHKTEFVKKKSRKFRKWRDRQLEKLKDWFRRW